MDTQSLTWPETRPVREFLEANEDILASSAWEGVTVLEDSETSELCIRYVDFEYSDRILAGCGIFLDVERETGRIGALTVYDYQEGLFAAVPALGTYLWRYRQAGTKKEQRNWSARLFHALLALASPDLAELVRIAYMPDNRPIDTGLIAEVLGLLSDGRYGAARNRLAGVLEPSLLNLRAAACRLMDDMQSAIADAERAFRLAPARGLRLFGSAAVPQFAVAWQAMAGASMAGEELLVVDASAPAKLLPVEYSAPSIESGGRWPHFVLAAHVTEDYAGVPFRVFVVDHELLARVNLANPDALRSACAYAEDRQPSETEHLLVVHASVLTAAGDLLGGTVGLDGLALLDEPIIYAVEGQQDPLAGKKVVLVLYPHLRRDEAN